MLELANITKAYVTANFEQVALNDVSIAFRDNEFVAVLGPSGSGKTTLLNIVGGLDHYDSGNLIIDGISTDHYSDRDWDAYRNNRIGFVFQSYNLIPHQSVLANVELALTLTGVSREERRARALKALDEVGLADHVRKRPNQLSGGQMQRVAIARALINDPEIVLADEPTGALDTVTSEQIMALLTQIAGDRLVIMVTHNPELAEQYATRTVDLRDGRVVSDSDPFDPTTQQRREATAGHRTTMSLATAVALSFNNLMTKKGRTLMTAFAGSIGIIGIAAILALATGVRAYIKDVEEDMLSVYPLTIQNQGMDFTAMLGVATEEAGNQAHSAAGVDAQVGDENAALEPQEGSVHEIQLLAKMFSSIGTNDLESLKEFLDANGGDIDDHVSAIQYYYNVTPQIFADDTDDGVRQVSPDNAFASMGFGAEMPSFMGPNLLSHVFQEMVEDHGVVESQYDVVAGHWPMGPTDLVVVLSPNGGLSDFMFYALGLLDPAEKDRMLKQVANEEQVTVPGPPSRFTYEEMLATTFSLVPSSDFYVYDEKYEVWQDMRDDEKYMKEQVENGTTLQIAGIVRPAEGATASALSPGLYYSPMLTRYIINQSAETDIVKDQLKDRSVDVFTGNKFDTETPGKGRGELDFQSLMDIDEDAIQEAFQFDESMLQIDPALMGFNFDALQGMEGFENFNFTPPPPPAIDLSALAGDVDFDLKLDLDLDLKWSDLDIDFENIDYGVTPEELEDAARALVEGYMSWAVNQGLDPTNVIVNFPAFIESSEGQEILDSFEFQVNADDIMDQLLSQVAGQLQSQLQGQLQDQIMGALMDQLTGSIAQSLAGQMQTVMTSYMGDLAAALQGQIGAQLQGSMAAAQGQIASEIQGALEQMMGGLAQTLPNALSIDEEAFAEAFQLNMSEEELQRLLMSMVGFEAATYEGNLALLGYADFNDPSGIDIFPLDFAAKEQVVQILEQYNADMEASDEEDKVITYTDIVGALMSSVTDIINVITYVLIAFVAISLVVSSIMIGVITYISVLERRKEIGILRSIGASKRDIRTVFNAETMIVGFVAGLIGILITYLLTIPANAIVYAKWGIKGVAQLPITAAVILILISVVLTVLAGLMPASAASRKDPVEALRSE